MELICMYILMFRYTHQDNYSFKRGDKMEKKKLNIQEYVINVLNFMAQGLFSSLIIGLILKQVGEKAGIPQLVQFGSIAQLMMGPAIGAAVAYGVKAPVL